MQGHPDHHDPRAGAGSAGSNRSEVSGSELRELVVEGSSNGTVVYDRQGATLLAERQRPVVAAVVEMHEPLGEEETLPAETADRLAFERLVSDLAARFVNVPVDQLDRAIVDSLRQIVGALDVDRSALWQFTADGEDLVYTHLWARPEYPPPPT